MPDWLIVPAKTGAPEIFSTGNFAKVMPVTKLDQRDLPPGPFFRQARDLYWEFAHGSAG